MRTNNTHWWQGPRGEWYVVIQVGLFLLVALGPRTWPGLPEWRYPYDLLGTIAGTSLMVLGGIFALSGFFSLGKNLTILPRPREKALLVETGAYRLVRHPIYSGLFFAFLGWGLRIHGWLTLGYTLLLFICLDIKARREERWLMTKFPGYAAYQKRVRRLIPFIY